MGRYVPPDLEGTISGNKLNKKHPLGSRASKPGSLTVRFEMPFATWCTTCPKPTIIGQGVRFNAAKTRVGSYLSTPIFSFRMKHNVCGGAIEIRTDPQNTAYVVTEGGRKRDDGEDKVREGDWEIMTDAEREKLRGNAFAKLEKTIEDREQLIIGKQRVEELMEDNGRTWDDPYEMNRRLRRGFRVGRYQREKEGKETEDLKDRMGLGIELVPEKEEDRIRAGLVDFGSVLSVMAAEEMEIKRLARPLFEKEADNINTMEPKGGQRMKLKSEAKAEQMKVKLVSKILENTRVPQDPFLTVERTSTTPKTPAKPSGIKRKRIESEVKQQELAGQEIAEAGPKQLRSHKGRHAISASKTLVNYDSDSD